MKQTITLDQAWDLIKRSSFQTIDGYIASATRKLGAVDFDCPECGMFFNAEGMKKEAPDAN